MFGITADNLFTVEKLSLLIGPVSLIICFALSILLAFKMERVQQQQVTIDRLNHSLEELDEQAKLIMRTDIELHKTQEELDRKITALIALQQLSRSISNTLEESQIFERIDWQHLRDLGFEKTLCFLWDAQASSFAFTLVMGFEPDEQGRIEAFIQRTPDLFLKLIQEQQNFSSFSVPQGGTPAHTVVELCTVHSFIFTPLLPKEGKKGVFFVGTNNPDSQVSEGDEELITVLGNQLGQALDNARLFEKTWKYQQELERKVEERTHDLKMALEEVKNISNRKTEFISAVSHELRTPLTSIKGYASLLLSDKLGELPEAVKLRLDKINRHSDELTHLVNDLLDIARIESGRITMKIWPCDIKETLAGVLDLLWVQIKERQIALSLDVPEEASMVFADKSHLNRVFINIIGNALKFTPPQGKITILSRLVEGGKVQVDITDTGCGIPEEDQGKIFEEFYRGENQINEQVKGTGLGLALVRHIIEAHQGTIWVTSTPGHGSTFSFTLPTVK